MSVAFPVVDLTEFDADAAIVAAAAGALDRHCREVGFFLVSGHGVPAPVIDAVWDAADAFFALPAAEKQAVTMPPGDPYGYGGLQQERLAASKGVATAPDLKETYSMGPPRPAADLADDAEAAAFCLKPTPWPDRPAGFQTALLAYYAEMERLAARIMRAMAMALGLAPDWFARCIDRHVSAMRLLHYPPIDGGVLDNQWRAGAHTDYGSLTILLPQADRSGLEIQAADGRWRSVPAQPDTFVVNLGDLMACWTNDRWRSTLHRVRAETPPVPGRLSIAFFHQPNWDAEIVPLPGCVDPKRPARYAPTRSGAHLMQKFRQANAA